jgi:hypothetical protein
MEYLLITPQQMIDKFYTPSFVNLKPHPIGGSTTAREMALMGRKSLCNDGYPYSIPFRNVDEMVKGIMEESKKIGTIQHLNIGNMAGSEWLNDNYWL